MKWNFTKGVQKVILIFVKTEQRQNYCVLMFDGEDVVLFSIITCCSVICSCEG